MSQRKGMSNTTNVISCGDVGKIVFILEKTADFLI